MKKILLLIAFIPAFIIAQNIVTEELNLTNGEIKIPGTLTYPKSDSKLPLVVFVHGSGNVDRNGNQAGTPIQISYIKELADSLNAKGIAFYRYDKRTSTAENISKLKDITLKDFASDADIVIDYYKDDSRFSGIHLLGHSQGSLVAMLAINKNVTSYISIAGAGESIDKTIIKQLSAQSPELAEVAKGHIEELMKSDTITNVNPFLLSLFAPQNQKFWKNWMLIHPEEEIKKINIPILIINGDSDLQVKVSDAESLKAAKPVAKMVLIPKMNHLMKEVNSLEENQQSYMNADLPISSELIKVLSSFIKA